MAHGSRTNPPFCSLRDSGPLLDQHIVAAFSWWLRDGAPRWRRCPDPLRRRAGAEARCLATCDGDASPTRLPIAAPRNLRHPIVLPDRTLPAPASSPTFCRPLRRARTAGRPPPVPCKAKAGALLGRRERDNASQAALRSGTGVLQKDAAGNPRDRHFHM